MGTLIEHLPKELVGFVLALALSLLIGFEREESRANDAEGFFGGVRTFPLIALAGFLLVAAFPGSVVPFGIGLIVVGALLAVTHHGSVREGSLGITTEIAALVTYAIGAGAALGLYWMSIATGVVTVMLLQEKRLLEGLATRIPRHEVSTLVRFLLLTGVILPVVPNHPFTAFEINPFKLWLVVVAVSGVSYASYLMRLRWGEGRSLILAGILGGAYSSTVTTVVLARKSKRSSQHATGYAGAIIAATGVMYVRLWILLMLFAPQLAAPLTLLFWSLGAVAIITGWLISRRGNNRDDPASADEEAEVSTNPLELTSAFAFAAIFLGILVITRQVAEHFGSVGVLIMAAIMGAADVDPFILGLTQYLGHGLELETAATAVVIAAATNNLMKGIYACSFGSRRAGVLALVVLVALAAASLLLF